ncbi:tyrosine-type recombinase/integrase [Shinella zoogloeoides]|uniref:Tyrosine-type recombinase/integrase n=1 Tax=Shinella zoogloeoides TaxID=352475 RepID=A0A6N8TCI6_SHIZO|nr:tyrosine-type recombinase/integrase [Shinella zoogloeoides]
MGQTIRLAGTYSLKYNFQDDMQRGFARRTRLDLLLNRYVDILWEPGSHKYNVTSFIGELDEILLGAEFSAFTDAMMDTLVAGLRQRGNSNATINRKMAALSKLLRKAYKMGDIRSLPEFKRLKEKAGRVRFLEPEEEARLFAAISEKSDLYGRFCVFLIDTGARLGEGIGLRWQDIQGERVTFWLTKSGKSRSVPLTERASAAIQACEKRKRGPFANIVQAQFRAAWNEAKQEVGLGTEPDVVPHILRHTCASRLVQGGIDIRRVQTWLGHQTLQMTMRYAHLASGDLDICVPILERAARSTAK